MKLIVFIFLSILFSNVDNIQNSVESKAIKVVINELIEGEKLFSVKNASRNIDPVRNEVLAELLNNKYSYVINNQLCNISTFKFLRDSSGFYLSKIDLKFYNELANSYDDDLNLNSVPFKVEGFNSSNWKKFVDESSNENTIFFNVKRHLSFSNCYYVQVEFVLKTEVYNNIVHSFFLVLNEKLKLESLDYNYTKYVEDIENICEVD